MQDLDREDEEAEVFLFWARLEFRGRLLRVMRGRLIF